MYKLLQTIKSRTAWTAAVTFVVNTVPQVRSLIPGKYLPLVDAVLGLLVIYFHVNPSQNYGQ